MTGIESAKPKEPKILFTVNLGGGGGGKMLCFSGSRKVNFI